MIHHDTNDEGTELIRTGQGSFSRGRSFHADPIDYRGIAWAVVTAFCVLCMVLLIASAVRGWF